MSRVTTRRRLKGHDLGKLKALVHYICYKCHDPSVLGATKLNKILWYSDVIAFAQTGKPITPETYTKQQFGPVPKHILKIVEELADQKDLAVREVDYHDYPKKEFIALTKPDISKFTPEEISLVDDVIDVVCHKHTATSISMASHDTIWELAEIGEELPLYAALASDLGEITAADVKWAKGVLSKTA
jgi:hypothetical protein